MDRFGVGHLKLFQLAKTVHQKKKKITKSEIVKIIS